MLSTLTTLEKTIQSRRKTDVGASYVASLLSAPPEKVLKKVVEEASELAMAAIQLSAEEKNHRNVPSVETATLQRQAFIAEAADVLFHLQVVLVYYNVSLFEVTEVLEQRKGMSGHQEKALRHSQS